MKRILTIVGIILVVLLAAYLGLRSWTKSKSPEATAEINQNGISIEVHYSQPSKRGRKIFGSLVPYGQVWRTGANEATTIEFNQNVVVAGQPLEEGKYSLWTIPGEENWIAIFNKETGQWGTNYDQTEDILRVPVAARKRDQEAEQFFISFSPSEGGTNMLLTWDNTEVVIPIRAQEQ